MVERDAEAIPCVCGGYAKRVVCTEEEIDAQPCSRPYECCARAFVCVICGMRTTTTAFAPDME